MTDAVSDWRRPRWGYSSRSWSSMWRRPHRSDQPGDHRDVLGEQTGEEGCLSVPGKWGIVTRPSHVKVRALNQEMEPVELEGEGLLARAFCHEIDHLSGRLYVDMAEDGLHDVT